MMLEVESLAKRLAGAYMKPQSNALRIAKLAAFTIIVSSIILGGFILAASWIQANIARSFDPVLSQELIDDLHPSYEHLVASEVLPNQQHNSVDQEEETSRVKDESDDLNIKNKHENANNDALLLHSSESPQKLEEKKVVNLDEIANILIQKNIKENTNSILEKRRNEELVDQVSTLMNLPSENSLLSECVNITTPLNLQHLAGGQVVVICKESKGEEKDSRTDEKNGNVEKANQLQSVVFPNNFVNQNQQMPLVIPFNNILHQIPMQPIQIEQLPAQQFPLNQFTQESQQLPSQPQMIYQQPLVVEQQQPQPQLIFPKLLAPPQQMMNTPNIQFIHENVPIKEVRINHDRIPVNHVLHHRVPINPAALNDVPISRMPITHLPIRSGEPQMRDEPVPLNHLIPPQPNQRPAENYRQDEYKFNSPLIQEPISRFPLFPPELNPQRPFPVEVRDPGVMRIPGPIPQESLERGLPMEEPNQYFPNSFHEIPETEIFHEIPNKDFRHMPAGLKPQNQVRTLEINTLRPNLPQAPKIIPIIPVNFGKRPQENRHKIRFPEAMQSEEVRESRMPIVTEITKIIPIRIEREESEVNSIPENSQPHLKNMEISEIKTEKFLPRPFPIPINAILDMIFRGIRPLINNREHSFPIPVDIKIERIENKPVGSTPSFLKKFEVIKKENPEDILKNSNFQLPLGEKNESEIVPGKNIIEAKVEHVEIFDKGIDTNSPLRIPGEAQVFKINDQERQTQAAEESIFKDLAFLPNGQGRGARVFPIPQTLKEAEIFSDFDLKNEKNVDVEVPIESSFSIANSEKEKHSDSSENKQSSFMGFPSPFLNFFPFTEEKSDLIKPYMQVSKTEPQTFSVSDSRSVKLYPITRTTELKFEELKPIGHDGTEENRPHFVQPRSV